MDRNPFKFLNILVILLVIIGFAGAEITAAPQVKHEGKNYFQIKPSSAPGVSSIIFEEEVEKGEEERTFIGAELIDLSHVTLHLSKIHTDSIPLPLCEQQFSIRPPLFSLHCALLI